MILEGITTVRQARVQYSGALSIQGTVKRLGVSDTHAKIAILEKNSFDVLDIKSPNTDGTYEFKALKKIPFIIIAVDLSKKFNAVIQDNIVPK